MIWPIVSRYELGSDPFAELHRLHREVNRLFDARLESGTQVPALNVWATEDRAFVVGAIPDIEPKDLSITVEGRVLQVEGERKPEPGVGDGAARQERQAGRFRREVRLPFDVAVDQVAARYDRGLVTIELPRSEQSKPRRIAVSAN